VIYKTRHLTAYSYASPVVSAKLVLRVTPREELGQHCIEHGLNILPFPVSVAVEHDFYGNVANVVIIDTPHTELTLQLHSPFEMGAARFGLMGSSPERPCDDVRGLDAPLCKLDDDAADFLDRPADQERRFVRRRSIIFLGGDVILARCRMTAIMAKASMTSET
jgi:hypothetical protein